MQGNEAVSVETSAKWSTGTGLLPEVQVALLLTFLYLLNRPIDLSSASPQLTLYSPSTHPLITQKHVNTQVLRQRLHPISNRVPVLEQQWPVLRGLV